MSRLLQHEPVMERFATRVPSPMTHSQGAIMASPGGTPQIVKGTFFFDPDDPIYSGHFPGHPVVPGSLIVHAFMLAGERAGSSGSVFTLENFRFRRFITPGEYPYEVKVLQNRLECRLYDGGSLVATGVLNL